MYDTIILGSGFFSFGYALTHPNCIIIEKSQLSDSNFYGSYNGFIQPEYDIISKECVELKEYFLKLGVLSQNRINVNALENAFCSFLKNKSLNFLLNTDLVSLSETEDGFCVNIYNNAGTDTLYSRRIIDTRMKDKKYLNVIIEADSKTRDELSKQYPVSDAFYPDEYVITYKSDKDINTAKLDFYNMWKSRVPTDKNKIISFAYSMHDNGQSNGIDDLSFGSVLKAFDCGVTWDL